MPICLRVRICYSFMPIKSGYSHYNWPVFLALCLCVFPESQKQISPDVTKIIYHYLPSNILRFQKASINTEETILWQKSCLLCSVKILLGRLTCWNTWSRVFPKAALALQNVQNEAQERRERQNQRTQLAVIRAGASDFCRCFVVRDLNRVPKMAFSIPVSLWSTIVHQY